jgi:hypothetical protein
VYGITTYHIAKLPRLIKKPHPKRQKEPRKTIEETSWMCETGTGQQVAQLLDSYMMITTWEIIFLLNLVLRTAVNISTVYLTVGKEGCLI